MLGDMNIRWLRFSSLTSVEGTRLRTWCTENGMEECVQAPTRGPHLLDLVLTELAEHITTRTEAEIADHKVVISNVHVPPLQISSMRRIG